MKPGTLTATAAPVVASAAVLESVVLAPPSEVDVVPTLAIWMPPTPVELVHSSPVKGWAWLEKVISAHYIKVISYGCTPFWSIHACLVAAI